MTVDVAELLGLPYEERMKLAEALLESVMPPDIAVLLQEFAKRAERVAPPIDPAKLADVLRGALAPLSAEIDAALVFGSTARGTETATSDIDVLVIGSTLFVAIVRAMNDAAVSLQRDVNPVVMTKVSFAAKLAGADRFVRRVMQEPQIRLLGDAHELEESSAGSGG
jgi:predicted nucleotidyltransferase